MDPKSHRRRFAIRAIARMLCALGVVVAVGACGGASVNHRSNLDPAGAVGADVPLYISLDVPTAEQLSEYDTIVTDFAGPSAWGTLSARFAHALSKKKLSWNKDVAPWIGNRVGVAIVNFAQAAASSNGHQGVVLIFPTTKIKRALAFAKQSDAVGTVAERDGNYMLVSTASTLSTFKAESTTKLVSSPSYTAVSKRVASDNAFVYANAHAVAAQIALTTAGRTNAAVTRQLAKVPADASFALGLTATSSTISLDLIPHDLSTVVPGARVGGGATVAGLPSDSILAAALNLTLGNSEKQLSQFAAALNRVGDGGLSGTAARFEHRAGLQQAVTGVNLLSAVLPALGPLHLAIGGTTLLSLHGGLALKPSRPAAARKLLASLYAEVNSDGDLSVSGKSTNFMFALGPFKVHVTDKSGQILALLNLANAAALLTPASQLSSNGMYESAVSQLPADTKSVPLYVSFSGVNALLGALEISNTQRARSVLDQLSYLIVGDAPGDKRIVLGLN